MHKSSHHCFVISLIIIGDVFTIIPSAAATITFCPVDPEGSDYLKLEGKSIKEYFECPGPDDPSDHTICCKDNQCCPVKHIDSVLGIDIKDAMVISITVIIISITTAITLIICCFSSNCPLYDTCAGGYKRRDILPFGSYEGSDTDLLAGNSDSPNNKKYYATANDIKIKVNKAEQV